jgi:hypothetical protein
MERNTKKEEKSYCNTIQDCSCPYCSVMNMISPWFKIKDDFWIHLDKSKIEFLKAMRTLIDDNIERIEKKHNSQEGLKKINIEGER